MRHWKYYLRFTAIFVFSLMVAFFCLAIVGWVISQIFDIKIGWSYFVGGMGFGLICRAFTAEYRLWEGRHQAPVRWRITSTVNGITCNYYPMAYTESEAIKKALKGRMAWYESEKIPVKSFSVTSVERDV